MRTVMDYRTGAPLPGEPSAELCERSDSGDNEGVVSACQDAQGIWRYVDPDAADLENRTGRDVLLVWVAS